MRVRISSLIDYLSTTEGQVTVFFGTLSSLSIFWNPGRLLLSCLSEQLRDRIERALKKLKVYEIAV